LKNGGDVIHHFFFLIFKVGIYDGTNLTSSKRKKVQQFISQELNGCHVYCPISPSNIALGYVD
jgi:hypothetical protein